MEISTEPGRNRGDVEIPCKKMEWDRVLSCFPSTRLADLPGRERSTLREKGKRSAPPKPHKHRRVRMNARTAAVRTPTLCAARPRTVRVAAGKNRNTKRKTTERRATDDADDDNGQGEIFNTPVVPGVEDPPKKTLRASRPPYPVLCCRLDVDELSLSLFLPSIPQSPSQTRPWPRPGPCSRSSFQRSRPPPLSEPPPSPPPLPSPSSTRG